MYIALFLQELIILFNEIVIEKFIGYKKLLKRLEKLIIYKYN